MEGQLSGQGYTVPMTCYREWPASERRRDAAVCGAIMLVGVVDLAKASNIVGFVNIKNALNNARNVSVS